MIAFYESPVDNLVIFNCGSVAACEGAVTDGTLIHQLGMDGSPGEFWVATGAPDDTSAGQGFPNTANLGDFNFFLSTRSEEHTSELQSLMRISYAVFCLKKKKLNNIQNTNNTL